MKQRHIYYGRLLGIPNPKDDIFTCDEKYGIIRVENACCGSDKIIIDIAGMTNVWIHSFRVTISMITPHGSSKVTHSCKTSKA